MANRFWVGGGSNTNWNATSNTNWALTSGGANNVAVPGSSDDVTFNGNGASANGASVISATITILSLTFTSGYTNTVTRNAVLTIAGSFTDRTEHSWAGSSNLTISAASTITSNGATWSNSVTFSGANTKTISGDWTITGALTISATTTITSANKIICGGFNHSAGATSGTCTIQLSGGTWTGSAGSATCSNPVILAGNVTFAANIGMAGGSLTYSSGTITTTGNTFLISASITLNTAGIIFNNISVTATATITNNSLLTIPGTLQFNASAAVTFAGSTGVTVANWLILTTDARTHTLVNGTTWTITTSFICAVSRTGASALITSNHATNKATIAFTSNRVVCHVLADFTRITATGRPIITFNGALTSCDNIFRQTDVLWQPMESFKRADDGDGDGQRFKLLNKNFAVMYSN